MSASAPSRPPARGAALLSFAIALCVALPFTASAAAPRPPASAAAPSAAGSNLLTLYSEPGLTGRRATYRTASLDVERQGFVARSAASTGMWTLCEGGEVASRCQTVQGRTPELKLSPQIVRPGLNALALYDQPGLKGERVVYSFPADRPAPFHARSAQTWGGPWALCERGFKHCQTLDGGLKNLDLVVAAVRPAPDALPSAVTPAAVRLARSKARTVKRIPAADHPKPQKPAASWAHARLVHAALSRPKLTPPLKVRIHQPRPPAPKRRRLFTPVRDRLDDRDVRVPRRPHETRQVREEWIPRRELRAHLVHEIADHRARRTPVAARRPARHTQLASADSDPYAYDYASRRAWRSSRGW